MGTTWLFNIIKEVAAASGTPTAVVADNAPLPPASWDGSLIIKAHRADSVELVRGFDARVPLMACVMVRDALPTFNSLIRTQSESREELLHWLEVDLSSYERVLPHLTQVAVLHESWIERDAENLIRRLSKFLSTRLTDTETQRIAEAYKRENVRTLVDRMNATSDWSGDFRYYDTDTQWHAGHIGPDEQIELQLSTVENSRLTAIQARVDELVERYSLWNVLDSAPGHDHVSSEATPMEYFQARRESHSPRESFGAWLARGLRYMRPGH